MLSALYIFESEMLLMQVHDINDHQLQLSTVVKTQHDWASQPASDFSFSDLMQ